MRLLILSDLHRDLGVAPISHLDGVDPCLQIDLSVSRPDAVALAGDIGVGTAAVNWADSFFAGCRCCTSTATMQVTAATWTSSRAQSPKPAKPVDTCTTSIGASWSWAA